MGTKCRFAHSPAEAQKLREATEQNGGVAPTIGAFRGPPPKTVVTTQYLTHLATLLEGMVFLLSYFSLKTILCCEERYLRNGKLRSDEAQKRLATTAKSCEPLGILKILNLGPDHFYFPKY